MMAANLVTRDQYIRGVLRAYRNTPGTTGTSRRSDRLLAAQLYVRGVPLIVIENALLLATARRLFRANQAVPLNIVRSLAYFLPVIDEVLQLHVGQDYFHYLRRKIQLFTQSTQAPCSTP